MLVQSGVPAFVAVLKIKHHRAMVKTRMKSELKKGLHESDLLWFKASSLKHAQWLHSAEFILNGEKFDVVRTEGNGDSLRYVCINDKMETELYKTLDTQGQQRQVFEDVVKSFCAGFINRISINTIPVSNLKVLAGVTNSCYAFDYSPYLIKPPGVQVVSLV